ncbi:hypothetical protein CL656_05255 [bacterium]|nr:hypothetical protein [bacterium]
MSSTEDKFSLHFKSLGLDNNNKKNPTLVSIQNDYKKCNQKLNDFKQRYNTKYSELFEIINSNNIDNDLLLTTLNNLNSFINENERIINQCYKRILGKEKELTQNKNSKIEDKFTGSVINNLQQETNENYRKYQADIVVLKKSRDELKNTIDRYNSYVTGIEDGLLTQTYALFYIWFVILIILVTFCFINFLNIEFGMLNNLLLIFTVIVALYFIYTNLNVYFV